MINYSLPQSGIREYWWNTTCNTEKKMFIKDFLSKCDQNCGFGHIYWRNP